MKKLAQLSVLVLTLVASNQALACQACEFSHTVIAQPPSMTVYVQPPTVTIRIPAPQVVVQQAPPPVIMYAAPAASPCVSYSSPCVVSSGYTSSAPYGYAGVGRYNLQSFGLGVIPYQPVRNFLFGRGMERRQARRAFLFGGASYF